MKQRNKLTTDQAQQTEQNAQLNVANNSALEFKNAEELLRHDAAQVTVPPAVEVRLHESTRDLPAPRRHWWQRLFE